VGDVMAAGGGKAVRVAVMLATLSGGRGFHAPGCESSRVPRRRSFRAAEAWPPAPPTPRMRRRGTAGTDPAGAAISPLVLRGAAGFLGAISWQVIVPVLPLHLAKIGYSLRKSGS
jgi:hypothetical protein